ncbi:UNVERIFIED_CONTAM: hypothetical protein Slati_2964100 [Sesamum latifolium]|uniref:Uncharacterized protein n=1 Tax=Sesamum latifolium TaxID=2727402 RepID=A0AAW2VFH3_9LAMI
MVKTEARTCYTKSKKYRGRCYFKHQISNCKTICKWEKFMYGRCSCGVGFCFRRCVDPLPPPPPCDGGEGGGNGGVGGGGEEGGGDESGEAHSFSSTKQE